MTSALLLTLLGKRCSAFRFQTFLLLSPFSQLPLVVHMPHSASVQITARLKIGSLLRVHSTRRGTQQRTETTLTTTDAERNAQKRQRMCIMKRK